MKPWLILAVLALVACSSSSKSKQKGRRGTTAIIASCEVKEEGQTFKMLVNENKNYRLTSPETKLEGKLMASPSIQITDIKKLLLCKGNDDRCIQGAIGAKSDPETALGKYVIDLHKQGVDVARADSARGYFIQGHGFYMGLYEVDLGSTIDKRLQYQSQMICQK